MTARREALLWVGTYTKGGRSEGIYRLHLDLDGGALRAGGVAARTPDPSFLALHPTRPVLYAVNELTEFEERPTGTLTAFAVEPASGALSAIGRRPTEGGAPCHVAVERTGRFALVANYVGGSVAALPLDADGRPGAASAVVRHQGRGPNRERQEAPHAHCAAPDPDGGLVLVADLGIDRVLVYRLDPRSGTLSPVDPPGLTLHPGAGPRHLAFHRDGGLVYVVNELDSTLTTCAYGADSGALVALNSVSLLPPDADPSGNKPAEVAVHPTGRWLYASNRGHDSLAVFALEEGGRHPRPLAHVPTGGRGPRHFALDPSGRWLLAANEQSDVVTVFRVDPATGLPEPTGSRVEVPAPVCVRFA
jgi:6-phosphogluconolactonase